SQEQYAKVIEEKYKPILAGLEEEVISSGIFEPKAVWGYWPCQSDGNDVLIFDPASLDLPVRQGASGANGNSAENEDRLQIVPPIPDGPRELLRFTFPRQKEGRRLCISDFFLPKSSGRFDVIGLSLVTIGDRASHETAKLFERGEYTRYLYLHG